jgi:hypothetical protein
MVCRKIILLCVLPPLILACESLKPKSLIEKPQTAQRYYTYSALLTPERPGNSPKLQIGLSLYQVKYPVAQAAFLYQLLYSSPDLDSYKDRVVREQREYYRKSLAYLEEIDSENLKIYDLEGEELEDLESPNWRYNEKFIPICPRYRGIVIEQTKETYMGGAHGMLIKWYYVIDLESQKLLRIDDFFDDYQGDQMRSLVYDELRKLSGLEENEPLSEGIFLADDPELTFNFFINEEGFGLHWNPYEIAPYAEGEIQITLPWKKIRPLMSHSGMELLVKFNIHLLV